MSRKSYISLFLFALFNVAGQSVFLSACGLAAGFQSGGNLYPDVSIVTARSFPKVKSGVAYERRITGFVDAHGTPAAGIAGDAAVDGTAGAATSFIDASTSSTASRTPNAASSTNATRSANAPVDAANNSLAGAASGINWQPWTDDIFQMSQSQNKFVILDLHAAWCHWCHVMDKKTYSDKSVQKLISEHFIPVSVDQASRPDLANRYEDYGWPATVVFNTNGQEVKLLSGFLPPQELISELNNCLKNPRLVNLDAAAGQSGKKNGQHWRHDSELDRELTEKFMSSYDTKSGGWTFGHKFLESDDLEYSMVLANDGDKVSLQRANDVLKLQVNLLDPVWGGMYQYSTDNDWKHAHFEKIMEVQSNNMRIYSLAYLLWRKPEHLQIARDVAKYLIDFLLSPEGVFYTSQDADLVPGRHSSNYFALDDKARRLRGIPRIDKHIYTRENAWAIQSFVALYEASGEKKYLDYAQRAASWIVTHRLREDHFLRIDSDNRIYLGDNLAMGRAFLSLYEATGDRAYLSRATVAADYLYKSLNNSNFGDSGAGFSTVLQSGAIKSSVNFDENLVAARFFNLLSHYSSRIEDKNAAQVALDYLFLPSILEKHASSAAGILLAERELNSAPVHVVVVGVKDDSMAIELFHAAQALPGAYKQIEFFDAREGQLPGAATMEYPQLERPAAFLCRDSVCSRPVFDASELKRLMETK